MWLDVEREIFRLLLFYEYILQSKSPCFLFPLTLSVCYITSNIPSCCSCWGKKKKERKSGCCLQSRRTATERCDDGMRAVFAEWKSGLTGSDGGGGSGGYFRVKMPQNHDNVNIPDCGQHVTLFRRQIRGGAWGGSADLISCYNETATESHQGREHPRGPPRNRGQPLLSPRDSVLASGDLRLKSNHQSEREWESVRLRKVKFKP